jgi:hypothetical protein
MIVECPLLAQSGHTDAVCCLSAFEAKRTCQAGSGQDDDNSQHDDKDDPCDDRPSAASSPRCRRILATASLNVTYPNLIRRLAWAFPIKTSSVADSP